MDTVEKMRARAAKRGWNPDALTIKQAAEIRHVSAQTLYNLIGSGRLDAKSETVVDKKRHLVSVAALASIKEKE